MRAPRLVLAISLAHLSTSGFPLAAQEPTGRAWCATRLTDPVVYLTPVFDTKLKAASAYRSRLIAYEFNQYIKGRFDYPRGGPFDAECLSLPTTAQADSSRRATELQVTMAKGRIVAVDWAYEPDPAEVEFAFKAQRVQGAPYGPEFPVPNKDKGFCVTNSFSAPLYVSAMFAWPPPAVNLAAAEIAWGKFLAGKHGYTGQGVNPAQQNPTYCSDGSRGDPVRMIAARIAGAKAAERKVVETGWHFGAAPPAGGGKPDNDPEPKPAPGPPPPPSPELLANDKLDCSSCFNAGNADMWATNRVQSNGFSLPKAGCVGPKFAAALKEKPYFNRVRELFEGAMKACPK